MFGKLYSMEVQHFSERRFYWKKDDVRIFKAPNFGQFMSRKRFESIVSNIQFSSAENVDHQILEFVDAVNACAQDAVDAGDVLLLDESMVKSFHKNLKGKMKIISKPRPIGNEFKNLCDGLSQIVLNLELYEGRDYMKDKEYVKEFGATTATCLRLTEHWKNSGRVVVADSWFGSVKSAVKLYKINGLYSNMLVKTAFKEYPKSDVLSPPENRGEWTSATATMDQVQLLAVKFKDLKMKQFISTCSASTDGPPRATKHCGLITRPQVAYGMTI